MRTSRFLLPSFVAPLLLLVAACSASGEAQDPVAAQGAEVSASSIFADASPSFVSVNVFGAGEVPIGAECAPGAETYSTFFDVASPMLRLTRCEGAPLRVRGAHLALSGEALRLLRTAVSAVGRAETTACETANAPRMQLFGSGKRADGTTIRTALVVNERYACDGRFQPAHGVEQVVEVLRALGENATPEPVPTTLHDDADEPTSIWQKTWESIEVTSAGHGTMPPGSDCVPGSERLRLTRPLNALVRERCAANSAGRFHTRTENIDVGVADVERVVAAMQASRTTTPAATTCTPNTEFRTGFVAVPFTTPPLPGRTQARYADASSACDINFGYSGVRDLEAVFTLFHQLSQATPD